MIFKFGVNQQSHKYLFSFLCVKFRNFFLSIFVLFSLYFVFTLSAYAGNSFYSIHVNSYKSKENAINRVSQFKELTDHSFYRLENIKGNGNWYRVYIGKYKKKNEAERKGRALKKSNTISYYRIIAFKERGSEKNSRSHISDKSGFHVSSSNQKPKSQKREQQLDSLRFINELLSEEESRVKIAAEKEMMGLKPEKKIKKNNSHFDNFSVKYQPQKTIAKNQNTLIIKEKMPTIITEKIISKFKVKEAPIITEKEPPKVTEKKLHRIGRVPK